MDSSRNYPDVRQHPDIEGWIKAIDADPRNGLIRGQFADWLEEQGYTGAAHGQRFLAKYGKYPRRSGTDNTRYGWHIGGMDNNSIHSGHGTGRSYVDPEFIHNTEQGEHHGLYTAMLPRKFFGPVGRYDMPTTDMGTDLHLAGGNYRPDLHPEKEFLRSANAMDWSDEDIKGIYE